MWSRLRYLLLPFSWLYGLGVWIRHLLYDKGILSGREYNKAVIGVGNLAVGGAGKSPMVEYLIRLLKSKYRITVVSRGYGRKTTGLREVESNDRVADVGDEPLQFKRKFPQLRVVVSEQRVKAVESYDANTDVFLLDDVFQHRALKPGLNILLFEYSSLLKPKLLLPAGNFRDLFSQRKRAQGFVVTKTPKTIGQKDKKKIEQILKPQAGQWLLFAHLEYSNPYLIGTDHPDVDFKDIRTVLLVTGIANPKPLYEYLENLGKHVVRMSFPDHHQFSFADMEKIKHCFNRINDAGAAVVTTVKDEQRLSQASFQDFFNRIPFFVLPVKMEFKEKDRAFFENKVIQHCNHYDNL